jgi:hypothetical protein
LVIQSLQHWHSNAVNCLKFKDNTLLSAGKESVLVQWHLDRQEKSFVSRLGNGEITNVSLSEELFYSCSLSDNSFKVMRLENNKEIVYHQNMQIENA